MMPATTATTASATSATTDRLTELDGLRIAAFVLLIGYHVGMFYVSWDWHVKSPRLIPALEPWMQLLSPWRMSLLFMVSGAATGLMLRRASASAGLGARSRRLLLPLLLGIALVVPPQPYLEVVEKIGYSGSFLDFLLRYCAADQGFCRGKDCLVLPTWNHLWFLPYLWVYTVLLLAWRKVFGRLGLCHPGWQTLTRGTRLLWLPCLWFAGARLTLLLAFPTTHNLVWDWFNHALYLPMFMLGAALFGDPDDRHGAWAATVRWRWWALALSLLLLVGMPRVLSALGGWDALSAGARQAWLAIGGARHWLPVLAALGFARKHLHGHDWAWRSTLNEAVFPAYIVHQTVIVVAAHALAQQALPLPLEAALVALITVASCAATYLLARQVGWLRPWLGMAPRPRARGSSSQIASGSTSTAQRSRPL
jgi:peptidoglycan/LPS O-acetylase OafA/YrhL